MNARFVRAIVLAVAAFAALFVLRTVVHREPLARARATPVRVAQPSGKPGRRFAIALAPYTYRFPFDAGAHPDYQTEWWYYTGHVRADSGHRYGYELTFFRFGLRPGSIVPLDSQSRWRGDQLYPAHFALTDIDGRRFDHVERFARSALAMGHARVGSLDAGVGDWFVRAVPGIHVPAAMDAMALHARAEMNGQPVAVDFLQTPEKPLAIHGAAGVSRKGGCRSCASHYYSYTRLRTTGTLVLGRTRARVDGISWMDHEFGSAQLESDQNGWDWFSVQFADRRELMLYLLRRKDGSVSPQSSGSVVDVAGRVRHLELHDFTVTRTGTWTSPHTGATYPSGWRVQVPSARVDVTLAPALADQELASAIGGTYWEGAVDVRDAGGKSAGQGYVELTGYAGGISL